MGGWTALREENRRRMGTGKATQLLGSRIVGCLVLSGAILLVVYAALAWCFGSASVAWAFIVGRTYVVSPQLVDLGDCQGGTHREGSFTIRNLSARPIRVVGWQAVCGCVSMDDLPVAIDAWGSRDLCVRVTLSSDGDDRVVSQPLIFYIDDGRCEAAAVAIRANVLAARGRSPPSRRHSGTSPLGG
jgi:hypothetical protein